VIRFVVFTITDLPSNENTYQQNIDDHPKIRKSDLQKES
jgi:hypothetical protein